MEPPFPEPSAIPCVVATTYDDDNKNVRRQNRRKRSSSPRARRSIDLSFAKTPTTSYDTCSIEQNQNKRQQMLTCVGGDPWSAQPNHQKDLKDYHKTSNQRTTSPRHELRSFLSFGRQGKDATHEMGAFPSGPIKATRATTLPHASTFIHVQDNTARCPNESQRDLSNNHIKTQTSTSLLDQTPLSKSEWTNHNHQAAIFATTSKTTTAMAYSSGTLEYDQRVHQTQGNTGTWRKDPWWGQDSSAWNLKQGPSTDESQSTTSVSSGTRSSMGDAMEQGRRDRPGEHPFNANPDDFMTEEEFQATLAQWGHEKEDSGRAPHEANNNKWECPVPKQEGCCQKSRQLITFVLMALVLFLVTILLITLGKPVNDSAIVGSSPPGQGHSDLTPSTTLDSKEKLIEAVKLYLLDSGPNTSVALAFGHPIGSWDVSRITDFSFVFAVSETNGASRTFNEDIRGWNTSQAMSLVRMFEGAELFNQPIGSWDVSSVTNMEGLFRGAISFNQPLSSWNVSKVQTMDSLFRDCASFDQPLDSWDMSNVRGMNYLFAGAGKFNQYIGSWKISKGGVSKQNLGMRGMFQNAVSFNQPLNSWDVSAVQDMSSMFKGCVLFDQYIGDWNVRQVQDMENMFQGCQSFNKPLGTWSTSSLRMMRGMFRGATKFNQHLGDWDVSNVKEMRDVFRDAESFNTPLDTWDVSGVGDRQWNWGMRGMFYGASSFNQPLQSWDVSGVQTMQNMFRGATAFNSYLGNWDVSSVTNMDYMFTQAVTYNQPMADWKLSRLATAQNMFDGASSFNQDISSWHAPRLQNINEMFTGAGSFNQDLCQWGAWMSGTYRRNVGPNIFEETNCPSAGSPDLLRRVPGPFCHDCK